MTPSLGRMALCVGVLRDPVAQSPGSPELGAQECSFLWVIYTLLLLIAICPIVCGFDPQAGLL